MQPWVQERCHSRVTGNKFTLDGNCYYAHATTVLHGLLSPRPVPRTPTTITFVGNPAGLARGRIQHARQSQQSLRDDRQVLVVLTVNLLPAGVQSAKSAIQLLARQAPPAAAQSTGALTAATPPVYRNRQRASGCYSVEAADRRRGTVTVGVDPSTLTPGTPNVGYATITPTSGSALLVPVVFFVSAVRSSMSVRGPSASTSRSVERITSRRRTSTVTSSGAAIGFSADRQRQPERRCEMAGCLSTSGSTPATLTVTVTPGTSAGRNLSRHDYIEFSWIVEPQPEHTGHVECKCPATTGPEY